MLKEYKYNERVVTLFNVLLYSGPKDCTKWDSRLILKQNVYVIIIVFNIHFILQLFNAPNLKYMFLLVLQLIW